ncbi:MAG: Ankyrin repeat and FYVE domain-containing protein 1 [Heterodermia speciosa]|uniref:Ankyrin repeat and FYVE domain-containing protein 1 n=1 Tax=Heterodermia speciosa TaxID=116794 RepID=A0A8H3I6D0_9LECA|nr:MAG: Ankyrin repeat and FYVE domain-containing protein 1 [Heterodermia speciosa]
MSHCAEKLEGSNVTSLTALTGFRSIIEAHLYFEELQSGLDNILIIGDKVEEMWCLADWHRYILKSWIEVRKQGHRRPEEKWFKTTSIWLDIIDAMVDLIFNYASPSQHNQRSILQETEFRGSTRELNLRNMLEKTNSKPHYLTAKDWTSLDSIIPRAWTDSRRMYKEEPDIQRDNWSDSPCMHEEPFKRLVSTRESMSTLPEEKLQIQRQRGIRSSDFQDFMEEIEEKIMELITLLPEEEQEELYLALERAFQTALRNRPRVDVRLRYIHFTQSLINTWLPNNPSIRSKLDARLRKEIQGKLEDGIAPFRPAEGITTKDLQGIIALGADIRGRVRGANNCSLRAAASFHYSVDLFKALVDAGAPYTIAPELNESPLQAAASRGKIDILAFLLCNKNHSFQIDVNHADTSGKTALHNAVLRRSEEAVNMLLQHPDIHVNVRNHDGDTPFLLAIQVGHQHGVVRSFLKDTRVYHGCRSTQHLNALHYAAEARDATLYNVLKHVKSINARTRDGRTPLHYAVSANSKPNVKLLLKNGADPTISSDFGTPLQHACCKRHLGPMRELLRLPESLDRQWPLSVDDLRTDDGYIDDDDYIDYDTMTKVIGGRVMCGSPVTIRTKEVK